MSFHFNLDEAARLSIREELVWLEEKLGDEIADFWLESLEKCLDEITAHPERHGFAPENGRLISGAEVRQKRFRPWKGKPGWRVLYMIDENARIVTILQVRSERQAWVED
jgi:mRNA-degrading endonuclease RelE of RelBE toxin-antitoxin system